MRRVYDLIFFRLKYNIDIDIEIEVPTCLIYKNEGKFSLSRKVRILKKKRGKRRNVISDSYEKKVYTRWNIEVLLRTLKLFLYKFTFLINSKEQLTDGHQDIKKLDFICFPSQVSIKRISRKTV